VLALAAEGRVQDALERSLELADAHGHEVLHCSWSLHDVVRFGGADRVVDRLERLAERPSASWWDHVAAAHARAAADGEPVALVEVSSRFRAAGLDLYACEAAAEAIRVVLRDPSADRVGAAVAAAVLADLEPVCGARTPALAEVPDILTPRELLVARRIAEGESPAEVASALGTSVRTVRNQVQRVYEKLGVNSREQLAPLA